MSINIHCNDCSRVFEVEYTELTKGTSAGTIVDTHTTSGLSEFYVGVCPNCQRKEVTYSLDFRREMNAIKEMADTLVGVQFTREEAIHKAVEWAFRPERETDEGFRAYLMER